MSDSKIPPDDFSATTPNIKVPKKDSPDFSNKPASDWEKTNYNYSPKDLQSDEWSKPANNAPKSPPKDFDKTNFSAQPPKDGEWGKTQVNINLPGNQTSQNDSAYEDFGSKRSDFREPQEESKYQEPKYQEPPKKENAEEKKVEKKKGGIPGWLWASAGLLGMFLFALTTLLLVYFIFLGKTGFEVILKSAKPGVDVLVDGSYWGVTDSDGTIRLKSLRAGQTKKIEIKHPTLKCREIIIPIEKAVNGAIVEENAVCESSGNITTTPPNLPKECQDIKDLETSRNCANTELDKLEAGEKNGQKFTIEQLLYAMNLYIINFDPNKAIIRNERDLKFIERAAGFMKRLPPNIVVEIGGHTDADGTDVKNQPLSENRATAVRNALVKFGINSIMLQTKGYGSKQPVASNDTADGKFKNRRIKYTVISK